MSLPMSDAPITAGIQRSYGGWDLSDTYWKGFYLTLRADRRRLHFMLRCLKPALGKDITLVIVQDWEEYYKSCDHFMEACLYCRPCHEGGGLSVETSTFTFGMCMIPDHPRGLPRTVSYRCT